MTYSEKRIANKQTENYLSHATHVTNPSYLCYPLKNFDNLEAKFVQLLHRPDEGLTLETLAFLPFTVANLKFNSVVNFKLPAKLSHRRSITVSLETYPQLNNQLELRKINFIDFSCILAI